MNYEIIKKRIDYEGPALRNGSDRFLNVDGEVPFVELRGFKDLKCIRHGFTTRLGGVSTGIYESLNLGLHLEDDRTSVLENYRRLGKSIGIDYTRISCPNQVHKDNILVVTEEDAGDGIVRDLTHFEVDAQITNVRNIPLIVYTADCVPILLADPVSRVIASVHAGWRGTVAGIAAKTVEKMVEVYGCLPENIHAAIGPSIGPDNYEVDETVIEAIYNCPYLDMSEDNMTYLGITKGGVVSGSEQKKKDRYADYEVYCHAGSFVEGGRYVPEYYKGIVQPRRGAEYLLFRTVSLRKRYMLNLWNLNELILINSGLRMSNIYSAKLCTMQNHDIFFSHRYTGGRRGLNAGLIVLA